MEKITSNEFDDYCHNHLPKYVKVGGVSYMLVTGTLMGGGLRINYVEYDGDKCDWNNQPINLFYDIVDVIPESTLDNFVSIQLDKYQLNLDGVINDCKLKMINWHKGYFVELTEILSRSQSFHRDLSAVLNKHSRENVSDTPDYVLANYLIGCLRAFDYSVNNREKFYGREEARGNKLEEEIEM